MTLRGITTMAMAVRVELLSSPSRFEFQGWARRVLIAVASSQNTPYASGRDDAPTGTGMLSVDQLRTG
jgi:hypothetical protein